VVIAIVGLLAAIAMPAFKSYTGRSKIAEIFTLAYDQKNLYQQLDTKGSMTSVTNSNIGNYVASSVINNTDTTIGTSLAHTVVLTLNTNTTTGAASIDPALSGVVIIFTPAASGTATDGSNSGLTWTCTFLNSSSSAPATALSLLSPGSCLGV